VRNRERSADTRRTVIVAGAANILVGVVKRSSARDSLIVGARVALADELVANQAEDLADEIDRRLSEKLPVQPHVFTDPTQSGPEGSRETGEVRRPAAP
jgi:divalent metal cation (Fe/Co/Zn/Cd) transporter